MPDLKKIKGFASVGIADVIGTGITAFFWFFIAYSNHEKKNNKFIFPTKKI